MAGKTRLEVSGNLSTSTARSGRPMNVAHASRIVSTFRIVDVRRTDRDARGDSDSPASKLCNRWRDMRRAKTPRTDIAFQFALLAVGLKRRMRQGEEGSDSPTPTDRDDVSRPATATVRSAERTRRAWSHQNMKLVQDGSRSAPGASRCRGLRLQTLLEECPGSPLAGSRKSHRIERKTGTRLAPVAPEMTKG